ncbi:MAG: hypothetical protein KKF41_07490 [Actinobacteria bacterium]|nr:hypothetical protein [Actinomycetota bacterium]MBU1942238.1 hypothetical protein [Actinomycetota bacterium]MBU2687413.1 hypothetical protein [Actinomycetota bacterium]
MAQKTCPKHPGQETMVPCLGCGRDFCRMCDPPRGAGQYCPRCYAESLERLSPGKKSIGARLKAAVPARGGKEAKPPAARPAPGGPSKVSGLKARGGDLRKRAVRGIRGAGSWFASLPKKSWLYARDHFPVRLAPRGKTGGMPPLKENWYKLVAIILGGSLLWILLVMITRYRRPYYYYIVAALVASLVVWALGTRFDVQTAIMTTVFALAALAIGELVVQMLFSANVIKKLDVGETSVTSSKFYRDYYYYLLTRKLLPSAAIAFLIGIWPLPKRLAWKGFAAAEAED